MAQFAMRHHYNRMLVIKRPTPHFFLRPSTVPARVTHVKADGLASVRFHKAHSVEFITPIVDGAMRRLLGGAVIHNASCFIQEVQSQTRTRKADKLGARTFTSPPATNARNASNSSSCQRATAIYHALSIKCRNQIFYTRASN